MRGAELKRRQGRKLATLVLVRLQHLHLGRDAGNRVGQRGAGCCCLAPAAPVVAVTPATAVPTAVVAAVSNKYVAQVLSIWGWGEGGCSAVPVHVPRTMLTDALGQHRSGFSQGYRRVQPG